MRKLLAVLMVGALFLPATASAVLPVDKSHCQFNGMNKQVDWTQREEYRTAWCVVRKWSVVGGYRKFIAVGDCESSWYRYAYNPNGHIGIFQHDTDYWPKRVAAASRALPYWDVKDSPYNPRSQAIVTARAVHYNGSWEGWECG